MKKLMYSYRLPLIIIQASVALSLQQLTSTKTSSRSSSIRVRRRVVILVFPDLTLSSMSYKASTKAISSTKSRKRHSNLAKPM